MWKFFIFDKVQKKIVKVQKEIPIRAACAVLVRAEPLARNGCSYYI